MMSSTNPKRHQTSSALRALGNLSSRGFSPGARGRSTRGGSVTDGDGAGDGVNRPCVGRVCGIDGGFAARR